MSLAQRVAPKVARVLRVDAPLKVSPPQKDPLSVYPKVPDIDERLFQVDEKGLSAREVRKALRELARYNAKRQRLFLGYQTDQKLNFSNLGGFLDVQMNNVGDPFESGNFTLNTKWIERTVLDYFAALWNAKWPHDSSDPESYWGYVLTMGSSEANITGMWNARDYLSGKVLLQEPTDKTLNKPPHLVFVQALFKRVLSAKHASLKAGIAESKREQQSNEKEKDENGYTPVAFYSEDTHYSVVKAMRVMSISTFYELGTTKYENHCPLGGDWPSEVPSNDDGSINIEALEKLVEFFVSKGYPPMVVLNVGTTFKGACDDVETAGQRVVDICERHDMKERVVHYDSKDTTKRDVRTGYWIHVDGALGASYLPFVEMAYDKGQLPEKGPVFDFRLPFVHSIAMSGHKWPGAPWPCGIYMTKTKYQLAPPDNPTYIGSLDTTFAGSRNGFSALVLWQTIARNSYKSFTERARRAQRVATYAHKKLQKLETSGCLLKLYPDREPGWLSVERSPGALTVRFRKCAPDLIFKYSLSEETLYVNGEPRAYVHMFAMDHVTYKLVNRLVKDLENHSDPFPEPEVASVPRSTDRGVLEAGVFEASHKLMRLPQYGRGFRS